jgi:hypothetical protein
MQEKWMGEGLKEEQKKGCTTRTPLWKTQWEGIVSLYELNTRDFQSIPRRRWLTHLEKKGETQMSIKTYALAACFLLGGICAAKEPEDYQKGKLLRMDSTPCGMQEKGGKSMTGEILGSDSQNKKTQEMLCPEYVLQAERVIYRIRPKDDKHPALLPIGETAQFRLHKDKLVLKVAELDGKEREYIVVSMTPRQDVEPKVASKN